MLQTFAKSIGLDIVITPDQRPYLIELQHGFGRRGLRELYPDLARSFRRRYFEFRQMYGAFDPFQNHLRKISSNKTKTYNLLSEFQPSSLTSRRWSPKVQSWLAGLSSDYVLAKPPLGCCGVGIHILDRRKLLQQKELGLQGQSHLLQEYIYSKPIPLENAEHLGCIRHIMVICCRENQVHLQHWPSYWRLAPSPCGHSRGSNSLTANISRGATAVPVKEEDEQTVWQLCEKVCIRLLLDYFLSDDRNNDKSTQLQVENHAAMV